MRSMLTKNDVIENSYLANYAGEILIIRPDVLKEEYRMPQYQLFNASSGFGCSPSALGSAVFGKFLGDGENCRMERRDFIGIIKPEVYEAWKREFNRGRK